MKIIECKEIITEKRNRIEEIVNLAKTEIRDLSEDEQKEIDDLKQEIEDKKEEIKELQDELDKQVPKEDEEETKACDDDEKEEDKRNLNKYISRNKMKQISLVKEIRNAIDENKKSVIVAAETRAAQVTGDSGIHDEVVETQIEGILEPLYANSVLAKLGARWYTGLPMGDVQIPVMGKQTVKWEGETDEADATAPTFTTVKLQPKRLSAYVDISKQLIAQDTIGVEQAIRRDLVNALNDKLEATLFGNAAGSTEQPAGLFYNASETNVDDFAGLCAFEAAVEAQNVYGNMKYVMSPTAKATFRGMIKGTNATGMVYEAGEMDGVETYVTTNVATKKFVYGDFSNLVVGSWSNVEITIDPYTQATKGCIRLVINAYFDFKPARTVAFNFGNVD
jgi:HK97 family phage major capsid protein